MNKLGQALISGRMLVTAQCLPPRGADAAALKALAAALPRNLDAIVVADNPDHIRTSAFSAAVMLGRETGTSAVLSMTTRDRNRLALMSDALGAAALDIAAVLCLSGHHQARGVCPEAAAANDFDSIQFTQAMKKMVLYGSDVNGRELEPEIRLQIGAAAHPYMRPMDLNLLRHKKKIAVGADFLLTQAVFDLEGFGEWMQSVRDLGLDKRTAILASVLPLTSPVQARELQRSQEFGPIPEAVVARMERAADAAGEGMAIAAEMARALKNLSGIRGIHILSGGCESLAHPVLQQAGL